MAFFKEEFKRCTECSNKEFVQKELLVIDKYADKVNRLETDPLPMEVLEKKIVYVCAKCGHRLDV